MFCGARAFQNCMYQLWLTPTSQHRIASGGMHRLAIGDDAFGPDRRRVNVEIRRGEFFPLGLPFLDVGDARP